MRKLIVLFFVTGIFSCCMVSGEEINDFQEKTKDWKVVTYDKCQYVLSLSLDKTGIQSITHKGNCNNPVHEENKYDY